MPDIIELFHSIQNEYSVSKNERKCASVRYAGYMRFWDISLQQSGTMGLKIAELVFVPPNAIDQLSCVLFRVLFHVYVCWSREHVNKTYFLFGKVFQSVS